MKMRNNYCLDKARNIVYLIYENEVMPEKIGVKRLGKGVRRIF
jgi:hypothetical protein